METTLNTATGSVFHNKILLVTLTVWILAQTIKVTLGVIRERRFNFRWLIGSGGMPSSHAAGASSLATACGVEMGFDSVYFAIAASFAFVTMFDAQGVRRSAGQQATILNQIMEDIYAHHHIKPEKLFELIGHTPFQVFMGGLLGVLLALLFCRLW